MRVSPGFRTFVGATDQMCVFPPNSSAESLVPKVMVLSSRALERCLSHEGGALMHREQ